jgi:phosphate/sulfate permease
MSDDRRFEVAPWLVLSVAVAIFVGWAAFPATVLYSRVLTPQRLLALAALLKLGYLLAGATWAFACRDRLRQTTLPDRRGSSSRWASTLLACLAPFQVVRNEHRSPRSPTSSTCWPTPS